ncbi:hypothetical protein BH09VER1_BH09VER1_48940 [soil metagenome]
MLLAQALPPGWIFFLLFVGPFAAGLAIVLLPVSLWRYATARGAEGSRAALAVYTLLFFPNLLGFGFSFLEIRTCYGVSFGLLPVLLGVPESYLPNTWWVDPLFYLAAMGSIGFQVWWRLRGKRG